MSFDWKSVVSTVAPVIGTALGGPFGALASSVVCKVLNIDTNSDEAVVANAMKNATPDQLLALQNAERQFKLDMEKLDIDVAKIDADDRSSARQREMAVRDFVPGVLAMLLTVGFFGLLGWLVAHEPPAGSATILNVMLGSLGTGWVTMLAYYYGSSASSKNKDGLLYNSTPSK